jgi:hypothetical protein
VLRLYGPGGDPGPPAPLDDWLLEAPAHARSRFQSAADPDRFALYSVHDAEGVFPFASPPGGRHGGRRSEHTLVAVREFRRVPLDASSLALTVFTARPGRAVPVVAALADFVERAVDLYRPGYVLVAHSLEEPRLSLVLTALQDALALAAAGAAAFSLDEVLGELGPLLDASPERYEYFPDARPLSLSDPISPYAV